MKKMAMKVSLMTHFGWTDIINTLALITYYQRLGFEVTFVCSYEQRKLVEYYCRGTNAHVHAVLHNRTTGMVTGLIKPPVFTHGVFDNMRDDKYKNIWSNTIEHIDFVVDFYELYNIVRSVRWTLFEFIRDMDAEDAFVKKMGSPRIVQHGDIGREIAGAVRLDEQSDVILDGISVLQQADEIHVIDSVWCALCYILTARGMLDTRVTVYSTRKYYSIFTPVLKNWTVV
jgi:hypothetical protein